MKKGLKITFLGTGTSQGVPVIGSTHPVCLSTDSRDKRLRVSVLISWDNYNYVIDCGPDFRQQMLTNHVNRLDGILFTHEHSDHTAGIDDIRPYFLGKEISPYMHMNEWWLHFESGSIIFLPQRIDTLERHR